MSEFSNHTQFPNSESKKFHGDATHGHWVVREDEAKRRGRGREGEGLREDAARKEGKGDEVRKEGKGKEKRKMKRESGDG